MRVIVCALVRNEASRFLVSALKAWKDFADEVIVLDDASTDMSVVMARALGAVVYKRSGALAWGAEAPARAELWEYATRHAEPGDIICVLDADMIPAQSPRELFESATSNAFSFPLYDLWDYDAPTDTYFYRADGMWALGPKNGRLWAVRMPEHAPAEGWKWPMRGIHCGHFPMNFPYTGICTAPQDLALLHYAYITPKLRTAKADQYLSVRAQLSPEERHHADSILMPATLHPLPFEPSYRLELAHA